MHNCGHSVIGKQPEKLINSTFSVNIVFTFLLQSASSTKAKMFLAVSRPWISARPTLNRYMSMHVHVHVHGTAPPLLTAIHGTMGGLCPTCFSEQGTSVTAACLLVLRGRVPTLRPLSTLWSDHVTTALSDFLEVCFPA